MAAGLTISEDQIPAFHSFLDEQLGNSVQEARAAAELKIDAALTATGATEALVTTLEKAGPFGAGNPEPVFVFPTHRIAFADVVGQGGHVRCTITNNSGGKLKGICFSSGRGAFGTLAPRQEGRKPAYSGQPFA